jgi:phosphoserine phosphatase
MSAGTQRTAPLLFAFDFDSTATAADTIGLIGELVPDGALWRRLEQQFGTDYGRTLANLLEKHAPFANPVDGTERLHQFLAGWSEFEAAAMAPICESRVLRGFTAQALEAQSDKVQLRPGFQDCLEAVASTHCHIECISVNWSASFIRKAVLSGGRQIDFHVSANEIVFDDGGVSTGDLCMRLNTARDKQLRFEELLQPGGLGVGDGTSPLSVYVGDSHTDLHPLLRADIGIVMCASASLQRLLCAFGVSTRPLHELTSALVTGKTGSQLPSAALYTVMDWAQVADHWHALQAQTQISNQHAEASAPSGPLVGPPC